MVNLFYDLALLLWYLAALPPLLWQRLVRGKRCGDLASRLGLLLPSPLTGSPVIWIHAVSVGEARAATALHAQLKREFPKAAFVISSTTATGRAEAMRSMSGADLHCAMPLDLSWIVKRVVRRLRPQLLFFVEGDVWYNLMRQVKKGGGRVFLVSGKLSHRSYRAFARCPFFARRLFGLVDRFCLQQTVHQQRLARLGIPLAKMHVTGNLKYDAPGPHLSLEEIDKGRCELKLTHTDPILTIGSTHDPEERLLLASLRTLWDVLPHLKVLLVPRHPERFASVAKLLSKQNITYATYRTRDRMRGDERVILIDTMGSLRLCYLLSRAAIVGGSFVPGIGGHNLLEPMQLGVPTLFGPYMQEPSDLAAQAVHTGAAKQVDLALLSDILLELLQQPERHAAMRSSALRLAESVCGPIQRTWQALQENEFAFEKIERPR